MRGLLLGREGEKSISVICEYLFIIFTFEVIYSCQLLPEHKAMSMRLINFMQLTCIYRARRSLRVTQHRERDLPSLLLKEGRKTDSCHFTFIIRVNDVHN